jgi:hypothetical protein
MRKRTQHKRTRRPAGAAAIAARRRDMQRIRDSVRDLDKSHRFFVGRIDPKLRQTAADGVGAIAELTGQAPTDVLEKLSPLPKKRGRKRHAGTAGRIAEAAKGIAAGMTKYALSSRLFPGLARNVAYNRTRAFCSKNKSAIAVAMAGIHSETS